MGKVGKKSRMLRLRWRSAYKLEDAMPLVKKLATAKFDETVEIAMRLGVDPKHADQMVRGTVVLPHGLGKSKKVCVIASGEKVKEAEEAGAEHVGRGRVGRQDPGRMAGLRCLDCNTGHDEVCGETGQDTRAQRSDAKSQDGDGDV